MMSKILYLAVFLTPESSRKLLSKVPALHSNVQAGHMTVAFKPDEDISSKFEVGRKVSLLVTGVFHDEKGQAVSVIPFGLKSKNKNPHVTVSTAEGIPAKYSNDLLAATRRKNWKFMFLEGYTDTYPRQVLLF
jgi:hypothetical protein